LKKFASIGLVTFYLLGTLVLPLGDFSVVKGLPAAFQHCKATENKDLNVFEFLAEHVCGIGQLIEETEHEFELDKDGDKPHAPIQFSFEQQQIICFYQQVKVLAIKPVSELLPVSVLNDKVYISDYISKIFRPPIV